MEQVFFNVPLTKLEPIFKRWMKEVQSEWHPQSNPSKELPETPIPIKEAAQFLNLTVPTMYSKVSKGEVPVTKRGKRLYFFRSELLKYLKEGRKKTNAEIEAEVDVYLSKSKK